MNELYEIAIESTEVELLLTEGFADKTKQLILKAVKKIKEMIKKMISYIKTKLIYKIKRNRKDIADIIKQNAIIRSNATVVVPTIFNQFETLLDALIKAIYDKLEMMLRDKDFDLNDIDFTSEIDAIKGQLVSVIEMPVKQAIHIIDNINKYSDNNLEDLQKIFNRTNELLTSYVNIAEKTDYDDRCIVAMQKIIPAINAIIMFINHLSDISKSVMVKITNNILIVNLCIEKEFLPMNDIYELAIESAEIELMVTEGVTDKTKDLVNKIIEKVKAFVKKMITIITTKLRERLEKMKKRTANKSAINHTADNDMVSIPKAFTEYERLIPSVRKKIKDAITVILRRKEFDPYDYYLGTEMGDMDRAHENEERVPIKKARDIIHHIIDTMPDVVKYEQDTLNSITRIANEFKSNGDRSEDSRKSIDLLNKILVAERELIMFITGIIARANQMINQIGY